MSPFINRRGFAQLIGLAPLAYFPHGGGVGRDPVGGEERIADNIIILVFDALSAENMSLYGYPRQTTPNIDRVAAQSTVYHRHYSAGSFTTPATTSMFTGTYPWRHRALHLYGTPIGRYTNENLFSSMEGAGYARLVYSHNEFVALLFDQFQMHIDLFKRPEELCLFYEKPATDLIFGNDRTIAIQGEFSIERGHGGNNPSSMFLALLHRLWRMDSQYDLDRLYSSLFPRGLPSVRRDSIFLLEDAIDWLKELLADGSGSYLGYFHFMPPHGPYNTRREFIDQFEDGWKPPMKPRRFVSGDEPEEVLLRSRQEYDEFIAYADSEFGRLYDYLAESGQLDDTLLVVTADHGELFERGIQGHITPVLYEPLIHIPLIIKWPGQARRKDVWALTSGVDLLPSLAQLVGQDPPSNADGAILPGFEGSVDVPDRSVFVVDAKSNPKRSPLRKASVAMIKGAHKLILYRGLDGESDQWELYDLQNDPDELHDLYENDTQVGREMEAELLAALAAADETNSG